MIWEEEQECKDFLENTEEFENEDFGIVKMFLEFRDLLTNLGRVLKGPQEPQYFSSHSDLIVYCSEESLASLGVESGVLNEPEELIYE